MATLNLNAYRADKPRLIISNTKYDSKIEVELTKRILPKEWMDTMTSMLEQEYKLVQKRKALLIKYKEKFQENEAILNKIEEEVKKISEEYPEWFL